MIVVAGEALVDVVISPEGGRTRAPGGSPLNVAIGLARLGLGTRLLTCLGDDDDGDLVRAHLAASKVSVAGAQSTARTAVAAARLSSSGDAAYEFAITWDLADVTLPSDASGLHFGSLGAMIAPGAVTVEALAREARGAGLPVSYDPNSRPAITPDAASAWDAVREHASLADLVKLSDEDAAFLRPGATAPKVAADLLGCGPAVVVVTSGDGPTLALSRDVEVRVPVPGPAQGRPVADTVGAGDSFMAALVAATTPARQEGPTRWRPTRDELARHLRAAHQVAAVTVTRPGADPPWRHELAPSWPD